MDYVASTSSWYSKPDKHTRLPGVSVVARTGEKELEKEKNLLFIQSLIWSVPVILHKMLIRLTCIASVHLNLPYAMKAKSRDNWFQLLDSPRVKIHTTVNCDNISLSMTYYVYTLSLYCQCEYSLGECNKKYSRKQYILSRTYMNYFSLHVLIRRRRKRTAPLYPFTFYLLIWRNSRESAETL